VSIRVSQLAQATHIRPQDVLSALHQLGMISCIDGQHAICIWHQPQAADAEQQDSDAGNPCSQVAPPAQQKRRDGGGGGLTECETNGAVPASARNGATRYMGSEAAAGAPQGKAAEVAGDAPRIMFEPSRLHFTPYHLRPEVKKSAGR
jgi:hypothetical protein